METPKSRRKPLQPRNQLNSSEGSNSNLNSKPVKLVHNYCLLSFHDRDSNKENQYHHHPYHPKPIVQGSTSTPPPNVPTESTLGEELSAVRKKLERLRADKERTEKLLEEKGRRLECEMMDILERGEFQRILEVEVDRLYRLKELHSHSMRISPVRSLRDKEQDRKDHVHTRSPRPLMFPPLSPSSSASISHAIPLDRKEHVHTRSPIPLLFPSPSPSSSSSSSHPIAVS